MPPARLEKGLNGSEIRFSLKHDDFLRDGLGNMMLWGKVRDWEGLSEVSGYLRLSLKTGKC
jgi:hypothetical protein